MRHDSLPRMSGPVGPTIVVIDDNQQIRDLVRRSLQREGYEVRDWANPREAIADLEQSEDFISLAVIDGVMPEMLGPRVAIEIARLRPGIPILLMSGHEAPMFSEFFGPEGRHFIAKPFVIADLIARVNAIIQSTPAPQ
ncbi:MAG TPA: response regulator [Gemmatimonadaceae bacterium]|nr:response regulator [Gemmatimonadaceae bacterium]